MHVLVLGGSGYVGAAVSRALRDAGHDVTIASRSGRSPVFPARAADLADPSSLTELLAGVDALVHTANPGGDWATEQAAVGALVAQRPARMIYTSGVWVLGLTDDADESSPVAPIPLVAGRPDIERMMLDAGGVVIRPGIVHGHGGGIPAMLTDWARQDGRGRYVGDSETTWPTVHVDDLAELYRLALEAPSGVLHGVAEPAVPVADIAAAADRAVGGAGDAHAWSLDRASAELGEGFAQALATSQRVRAPHAAELGWRPRRSGIVEDLDTGSYRR